MASSDNSTTGDTDVPANIFWVGGPDNEVKYGGAGDDFLDGGAGEDTIRLVGGGQYFDYNSAWINSIERIDLRGFGRELLNGRPRIARCVAFNFDTQAALIGDINKLIGCDIAVIIFRRERGEIFLAARQSMVNHAIDIILDQEGEKISVARGRARVRRKTNHRFVGRACEPSDFFHIGRIERSDNQFRALSQCGLRGLPCAIHGREVVFDDQIDIVGSSFCNCQFGRIAQGLADGARLACLRERQDQRDARARFVEGGGEIFRFHRHCRG